MASFLETLRSGRVLLMDGAMGTELQRAGIGENECYEAWNLMHPDKVRAIHQAYVGAGAEVLLTNTFQANPSALSKFGLWEQRGTILSAGLEAARSVAGEQRCVLLDAGPYGGVGRREAAHWSVGQASASKADGILVETSSDIADLARILKDRARTGHKVRDLPVLFSWTYRRRPSGSIRGQRGYSPAVCARLARRFDIAALGVNCGCDIGMAEIAEVIHRYRLETDLPLFARPNAGTPTRMGESGAYPLTPEKMAARLPELLEAGVNMVGGCCGTTPEHIAAMRPIVDAWNAKRGFPPTQV
jgi:5-methyltetrahydrofolate--homocysteine methyltransferase